MVYSQEQKDRVRGLRLQGASFKAICLATGFSQNTVIGFCRGIKLTGAQRGANKKDPRVEAVKPLVISLRQQGLKLREIEQQTGLSTGSIQNILYTSGVTLTVEENRQIRAGVAYSDSDVDEMVRMRQDGIPISKIALRFGMTRYNIKATLRGRGVTGGSSQDKYRAQLQEQNREDVDPSPYLCSTKRLILCHSCNQTLAQEPHSVVSHGAGCSVCSGRNNEASRKKYLLKLQGQNREDVDPAPYISTAKRRILCHTCSQETLQLPSGIVYHSVGCPVCSGRSTEASREKYLAKLQEQNREDLDGSDYESNSKRRILCRVCNQTASQKPNGVISRSNRCPSCSGHSPEASREKYLAKLQEQNREDVDPAPYHSSKKRRVLCRTCNQEALHIPNTVISRDTRCLSCARARVRVDQDVVGKKFGNLTVTGYVDPVRSRSCVCQCDCGSIKTNLVFGVRCGNVKSCGCIKSGPEKDLLHYIQSLGFPEASPSRRVIRNASGNALELDVYVESRKTAFEYCGLYWHGQKWNGTLARMKHLEKLNLCQAQGITLVTVFADEWLTRNEIVRDRVAALLGVGHESIGARKCQVFVMDREQAQAFEEENHLQGSCPAQTSLSLSYQNQLVATASFARSSASRKGKSSDSDWELVRYTVRKGLRVQGGLSRLLALFWQLKPHCRTLVSFADRRWSTGKLYQATGFRLEKVLNPDYRYFKAGKDFPRYHKFGFRKQTLARRYNLPVTTEWEMAQAAGFDRIWDCGLEKWVLDRKA